MQLPVEHTPVTLTAERVEGPEPGEYWRLLRDYQPNSRRSQVPAGTLFLLTEVHLVEDGLLHSVDTLAPPPYSTARSRLTLSFMADDFFAAFERVDQAQARHAAEARLSGYMDEFRAASARVETQIGDLKQLAAPTRMDPDQAGGGTALIEMRDQGRAMAEQVERVTREVTEATEQAQSMIAASSHQIAEQVKAAMRRPQRILGELEKALTRMAAYCGEDVIVEQVLDGPRAAEITPIAVYQAKRYMDEEYLVHLAEGGADFRDWESFGRHLYEHPETLDRIIPAPIGMCMMQYRRKQALYVKGHSLEDLYANADANKPNFERFLLYRDGHSLWAIRSPVTRHNVARLYPTDADLEAPFRDRHNERIRQSDLAYSKSFSEQESIRHAYRLLVLVLWGIQDREGLFRSVPHGQRLLHCVADPDVFSWVRDAEYLLPDGHRDLVAFLSDHTEHLHSGARVLCNWRVLVNKSTARNLERAYRFEPQDPAQRGRGVAVLQREHDEYYVKVPMQVWSYGSSIPQRYNARIWLSRWQPKEYVTGLPFIVLDAVALEEVEYYMTSRYTRQRYLAFYETFVRLREILRAERRAQADMRAAVGAAFRGADVAIEDAWRDAVRAWRGARRGAQLPDAGAPDFDATCATLTAAIRAQLADPTLLDSDGRPTVLAALADAEPRAADAFALTRSGRGRLVTYLPGPAPEHGALVPAPFVRRLQWRDRGRNGWSLEREALAKYAVKPPAAETLLWEAAGRPRPLDTAPDAFDSLSEAHWTRLQGLVEDRTALDLMLGRHDETFALHWGLEAIGRLWRHHVRMQKPELLVPVASRWGRHEEDGTSCMEIWALQCEAIPFICYHVLSGHLREQMIKRWHSMFASAAPREQDSTSAFELVCMTPRALLSVPYVERCPAQTVHANYTQRGWSCSYEEEPDHGRLVGSCRISAMPRIDGTAADLFGPAPHAAEHGAWWQWYASHMGEYERGDVVWEPRFAHAERWTEIVPVLQRLGAIRDKQQLPAAGG